MPFEFGDIVLIPFPFTDQTSFKRRPAVVVSNTDHARARPDIVVMPITSQPPRGAGSGDVTVID